VVLPAVSAQEGQKQPKGIDAPADGVEFPAELTGRGLKMNYGPFLTYSVIHRSEKSALDTTLKGVTVRLGKQPVAALCFDLETFRVSAAWLSGYLDISHTNLNGYKGEDLATPYQPVLFTTRSGPGWATTPDGRFVDLRPEFKAAGTAIGKTNADLPKHLGLLPPEIARYKGLYLHGEQVIFSYTIGKSDVLDLPGMRVQDGQVIITRTLQLDAHADTKTVLICESVSSTGSILNGVTALEENGRVLAVGVQNAPKDALLQLAPGGRVHLKLPPAKDTTTLRIMVWSGPKADLPKVLGALRGSAFLPDLRTLCKGGPPRWPEVITVQGKLGKQPGAYQVDDIPLPDNNPWSAWMRPGAFDFFPDGRAALCTWNGDVWLASGLNDKLTAVRWRRFASGLFEPLGLKVVDDKIYVLGRDQITRLHDLNGDGEADFYENFNSSAPVTPTFHGFAMELHTDREGNFYYSRGGHRVTPGVALHCGIIKVSRDGSTAELYATGLREANGMSVGPNDVITAADNQGNWVPSSKIDIIRQGGFYGYNWGTQHKTYEKPLCWIPHHLDNSSGGQVWVTSDRWGPFKGSLLHTSYGTCTLFLVLSEKVGEQWQGGVCAFPLPFSSGIMRGHFHPNDGQLYLCGLKGWSTKGPRDGGFYRVRYTGRPVYMPSGLRVTRGALHLTFPCELDMASAQVCSNYAIEQWNYRWSSAYGSKDWSVANPNRIGRDRVEIKRATLSADRRTVTLEIPQLRPVMQMGIHFKLRAADGNVVAAAVYNTINVVP
jgi:hypothetical protein